MAKSVAFDVETEVDEDQFYLLGEKLMLAELAEKIEDEDKDEELNSDASTRFNQAMHMRRGTDKS